MLAQKIILSYGSKLLIQFIQIATSIVVARIAGPTVLGTVAFGLAFVSIFKFIADLGMGSAHIKLISEGRDEAKCIGTFIRIKLFLTGIFFLTVLMVLITQKYIFNIEFESITHQYVIIIMLVSITISELFFIPKNTFIAKTEQAKQDIPDFTRSLIYQILRVIIVLLGYKAVALAFGNLISTISVIPVFIYLFKDYPIGRLDHGLTRQYFKIALPLIAVMIAQTAIYWSDKVILQYLTNSEQVGYYTAGCRIGGFVKMIGGSAGLLFFPIFSEAVAIKKYDEINVIINKFERFSYIYILPFVFFAVICSDLIVKVLLGNEYLPSIPILSIITIATYISVMYMPYGNVLSGIGLFKLLAKLYILEAVFFIIICFIFVSPNLLNLKGVGIASSIMLSDVLLGSLFVSYSRRNLKELKVRQNYKLLIYGISYSILAFFIYRSLANTFILKLVYIFIYFGAFWALLILFKLVTKNDLKLLTNLFDLAKMKTYIKSEIINRE